MTDKKKPVAQATFYTVDRNGKNGDPILEVMFNPASLTYTLSNTMKEESKDKKQHVKTSTAKLSMDLIFDTTGTGNDVRDITVKLANLMGPKDKKSKGAYQPQVIAMDWGSFRFKGVLESYKETIDFFAPEGVPLRCTVNISMSNQDKVFEDDEEAADVPKEEQLVALGEGQDISDIAEKAGADPRAAAASNGIENPRRPAPGMLALPSSVRLSPPVAFASASAALGASANGAFGATAAIGASASLGAGANLAATVAARGIGAIGGTSSAGVSAVAGAFAGLRGAPPVLPRVSLNIDRVQQSSGSAALSASATSDFGVGGRASASGASGLNADVGASATLRVGSGITFDE